MTEPLEAPLEPERERDPTAGRADRLSALIDRFAGLRVLVVGDVMLDEYRVGDVERVSPEAPVPIVRVAAEQTALGGAGNVARNVLALGGRAALVGLVGSDPEGERVRMLAKQAGLPADGLVASASRPTSHKLRVVARGQQMLRLDREVSRASSQDEQMALRAQLLEVVAEQDVVILADYDKGIFAEGEAGWLIERALACGAMVVADPKRDLVRFRGASLVKPNRSEALACVGRDSQRLDEAGDRQQLLEAIRDVIGGGEVVVTRGASGMSALDASGRFVDVPTRTVEVFDVQGAGDTTVAALALCRAAGASLAEACIVANAAAAAAVEQVGTAAVEAPQLRARLPEAVAAFEREYA